MATTETATANTVRRSQERAPGPARRVKLPWMAAAVGAALVAAALVLWGFGRVAHRTEVLVVTAPVAKGAPIPVEALGTTNVAVDSPSSRLFIPAQRSELVGKVATIDLAPGDLMSPSMISKVPELPATWQEIGAVLKPGRFPAPLVVGDRVRAVTVKEAPTPIDVVVVKTTLSSDKSVSVILAVAPESSTVLAQWAATDNLVLIRVAR
jgi:hypothetical protein